MALTSKTLAPFIAVSILADSEDYNDNAKDCVAGLANDLQLDDLDKAVTKEITTITKMDDDTFDDYLEKSAQNVTDKEAVLLICLNVLASDRVITIDEMESYFTLADILEVSEDRASEIFDDFVDEADDLVIENDADE